MVLLILVLAVGGLWLIQPPAAAPIAAPRATFTPYIEPTPDLDATPIPTEIPRPYPAPIYPAPPKEYERAPSLGEGLRAIWHEVTGR